MHNLDKIIESITPGIKLFFKKAKGRSIVIQTHDIPDPDAMASAEAMRIIARFFGFHAKIISNGNSLRRENLLMVKECKIPIKLIGSIKISKPIKTAWIFVDCVPGGGNVKLHPKAPGDLFMAIDHHGKPKSDKVFRGEFVFSGIQVGATATILVSLLISLGISFPPRLGSALSYAIITDTMDFSRDSFEADLEAYSSIFHQTNQRIISRLRNVTKPKSYFRAVYKSLDSAQYYRNIAWVNIGSVETGEIVAEMADFILGCERITWAIAVGYNNEKLFISLRTSREKAHAGKLIKRLIPGSMGAAGGHERMAGGFVYLDPITEPEKLADSFLKRFIRLVLKIKASSETPQGNLLVG